MYKKLAIAILLLAPLLALIAQEATRQVPQAPNDGAPTVAGETRDETPVAPPVQPAAAAPPVDVPGEAGQGFGEPFPTAGQPMMDPTPGMSGAPPTAPAPVQATTSPTAEPPPSGVMTTTDQSGAPQS